MQKNCEMKWYCAEEVVIMILHLVGKKTDSYLIAVAKFTDHDNGNAGFSVHYTIIMYTTFPL